jgi:hypothetical protein
LVSSLLWARLEMLKRKVNLGTLYEQGDGVPEDSVNW